MTLYARDDDGARNQWRLQRNLNRQRTRRPLRGHVPSPTWVIEGAITLSRFIPPAHITIDPVSHGDLPEHKQIVAVDGWSHSGGDVLISWQHNTGYFLENHLIVGGEGSNRVVLPDPYIIEYEGGFGGEWIRPEIQEEPEVPSLHLSLVVIVEAVPV